MKKVAFLLLLFAVACTPETTTDNNTTLDTNDNTSALSSTIEVEIAENPELDYKNLRIYPIVAEENFIKEHEEIAAIKNLKEGMEIDGFRITEKKPYGRFEDAGAVNNLTIQNKSQETIYLMEGDVISGGKQDRVLAQNMVVPPRTITDISVFCVEHNRWNYKENEGNENPDLALNYAFSGYYNVASPDLRRTIRETQNQQAVWNKVDDLTAINNAQSSTAAYTNLENSETFTTQRNEYIDFFKDKMDYRNDVVGMVVVSGKEVLGVDIYSHPTLFKKQYEVLLNSYITDAIHDESVSISDHKMKGYAAKLKAKFNRALQREQSNAFKYKGKLVHYTDL